MITNHTQLLNALIEKINPLFDDDPHYMEIGVQSVEQNFNKINCRRKIGIDPNITGANIYTGTSDKYFNDAKSFLIKQKQHGDGMAVIFIDGDHTKEQAKKDFENALEVLSDNGFIVIHDVLPENEEGTKVPRETKQWWGTVYQWAMDIQTYDGVGFKTFNIDNGCMLVWKDSKAKYRFQSLPLTWEGYKDYGHKLMNVTNEVII